MNIHNPKRALILIDVQNEYVTGRLPIEYPPLNISLRNIEWAIEVAQEASLPLIVVQQVAPPASPLFAEGGQGVELHPVVSSFEPDLLVRKALPSAFAGTGLADWLRQGDIDTLVVVGYMSQNCNESTIRQAAHEGWAVEYLHDAAGTVSFRNAMGYLEAKDMHEASCVVLQSRFAAVMSTAEWVKLVRGGGVAPRDSIWGSWQGAHGGLG